MSAEPVFNLDSFSGLEAAVQDAHDQWRRGDFAAALDKYCRIVQGRLSLAGKYQQSISTFFGPADMFIIERLADLTRLFGHANATSDLLEVLSNLSYGAENFYAGDYYLIKRIDLLLGCGQPEMAHCLLEQMEPRIGNLKHMRFSPRALEEWEAFCNWPAITVTQRKSMLCLLYLVIGRILSSYGQYTQAIAALERGAEHEARIKTNLSTHLNVQFKLALAAALLEKGEIDYASTALANLKPVVNQIREPWPYVRWIELKAKLNHLTGRLSLARDELLEVVYICRRFKFTRAAAAASLNLANVLILLNQTSVANELLRLVCRMAEEIDDQALKNHTAYLTNSLLVRSYSQTIGNTQAVTEMRGALAAAAPQPRADLDRQKVPASGNFLGWFEDRAVEFYCQLIRHDIKSASTLLLEMKRDFEPSDSELVHVRLQVLEGTLNYYQDKIKEAESQLSSACVQLESLGMRSELWQTLPILGWCWRQLGYPDNLVQSLNDNAQNLLNTMASEMAPLDQARFLLNKSTADEEYIDSQVDRLLVMKGEVERAPFYSRPLRKLSLMRRLNDLLVHIVSYKNKLAKQTIGGEKPTDDAKHHSLWRRLVLHDRTRASIYFLVLPNRVLWIRSTWLDLDFGVAEFKRVRLRDLIQMWHLLVASINKARRAPIAVDSKDQPRSVERLLRNLIPQTDHESPEELSNDCNSTVEQIAAALKIREILSGLPKYVRSLIFHPDDVLHGFPFAAIQYDEQYLIERFAVSEGLDYSEQKITRDSHQRNALLVSVSTGTSNIPALPQTEVKPLPGTREEVKKISEWLATNNFNVRVLSDSEASKPTLLRALPAASLLHIACHGVFTPNDPARTGLLLIPEEGGIGEIVTLKELSRLNLTGIEHVTLSSCWSADNFVLPGRWVFSFPQILRRAGARSVLASLWEVDDRVAVSFMKRFYDYLEHHPRDEALRLTQLDCLNKKHSRQEATPLENFEKTTITAPFYWASYILCGDYGRLRL